MVVDTFVYTQGMTTDWNVTATEAPGEGIEVDAMDSGGHVQRLVFERGLWWFPDRSMYVYFVPQFWRAI